MKSKLPKTKPINGSKAVTPLKLKADAMRAKLTPKELASIQKDFAETSSILGIASPMKGDVEQLLARLPTAERNEVDDARRYEALRSKGASEVDDWRLSQSKTAEGALRMALEQARKSLHSIRDEIASIKVRLIELQGGLVAPAKALPGPAVISAKPPVVENPKDVTWVKLRRSVLEACLMVAAKEDVRFYLEGVYLHADKRELRAVATNGHTLLLHSTHSPEDLPPWLAGVGIILPRDLLAVALSTIAKIEKVEETEDEGVSIGFAPGWAHATLRDSSSIVNFRLPVIDGKFPDYQKLIESAGQVLAGGERQALTSTSINAEYLKQAAAVSAKLMAKGLTPFLCDDPKQPVVITFMDQPGALFLVMPVASEAKLQMPAQTMALIGKGLEGTLAALKAVNTRRRNQLAECKSTDDKNLLIAEIAAREQKIQAVVMAMKGKVLEAPKAAA